MNIFDFVTTNPITTLIILYFIYTVIVIIAGLISSSPSKEYYRGWKEGKHFGWQNGMADAADIVRDEGDDHSDNHNDMLAGIPYLLYNLSTKIRNIRNERNE